MVKTLDVRCPFCSKIFAINVDIDSEQILTGDTCCHYRNAAKTLGGKVKVNFATVHPIYVEIGD